MKRRDDGWVNISGLSLAFLFALLPAFLAENCPDDEGEDSSPKIEIDPQPGGDYCIRVGSEVRNSRRYVQVKVIPKAGNVNEAVLIDAGQQHPIPLNQETEVDIFNRTTFGIVVSVGNRDIGHKVTIRK